MELYIINNWLEKANKSELKEMMSINFVKNLFDDIKIEKDKNGKPVIVNDNKFINWSHNEDFLVIAYSELGNVGVDIENYDIKYDEFLYGWVLHDEEKNKIKNGVSFSEVWTRKESILKCSGEGIHDNMHQLNSYNYRNVNSFLLGDNFVSVCSDYKEIIYITEI